MTSTRFRLLPWLLLSLVLFAAAIIVAAHYPSSPLAVTLYKAHMASLAGWIGYWLDRFLFPYSRPHQYFADAEEILVQGAPACAAGDAQACELIADTIQSVELVMIRRAIIVAACLIAVSLGA